MSELLNRLNLAIEAIKRYSEMMGYAKNENERADHRRHRDGAESDLRRLFSELEGRTLAPVQEGKETTSPGWVAVPKEPTEHELFQIMIAGEMDTSEPKKCGLARARDARNAMLATAPRKEGKPIAWSDVVVAASALVPYLEEGWDEQDDPADVAAAEKACADLIQAVDKLAAAPDSQGWVKCSEKEPPKDGTKILVLTHFGDIEISEWYSLQHSRYEQIEGTETYRKVNEKGSEGWNSNNFDYWMPLPAAPRKEGE